MKGVAGTKEVELGTQVRVSFTEDVYIVHRLDESGLRQYKGENNI